MANTSPLVSASVIPAATRYDPVAMAFHWIMALLVFAQLALGWWMTDLPKQPAGVRAQWFDMHKSIGLTLAALIVARLAWRLAHPAPRLPASLPDWQAKAARVTHITLYVALVVVPLSGYLGASFGKIPLRFFGANLPAWAWGWDWPAARSLLNDGHGLLAGGLAALIGLHVLATLAHLWKKDEIFARMRPTWARRK